MPVPPVVFFDLGDTLTFVDASGQTQRFADALDVLQVIAARGYRLGVISNQAAGTTVNQIYNSLVGLGLGRYIERELITISTEIPNNVGKPARPIFDLALSKAGHPTASIQSIFVTETLSHIQAARGFGWRAILKRNAGACQPSDGECSVGLAGLLALLPTLADISATNFDLAPQPKLVDGLWAVPIDIQQITASLTFDGQLSTGNGDATLNFKMGRNGGNPIFDLRQTIHSAELDGVALPVAQVTQHDFGGGANAELRVVGSALAADSSHSLRLVYSLGTPQASAAGSYLPAMTWSNGPRLAFNFGFTDLGAGRYLEAWMPANLIYDQFSLTLELRVINTAIPHTVITNGTVTLLGTNHWRVNFPARFTAFSPLLELRAADSLSSQTDTTVLPISGTNVTVEAWKLTSSATNLTNQIDLIKTFLANNERSTGAYLHGNRFVAFLNVGGMEYDGGTTTSQSALSHEAFHSWWGRGVKPASQPDAWFDEAWTTYNDNGAIGSNPFNFPDPPVTLCPRNAWVRVTAGGAYTAGNRFWEGVAALIGVNTLRTLMGEFYQQHHDRPVTTANIEEFLICRTGNTQLVDAFHRFVYGFDNPSAAHDLWLHDEVGDPGNDLWTGRFWDSPDLWIRNADDDGITHQATEYGQDNWIYARVHNRGGTTVRHFVVTFNVKQFAGTQFTYPADFLPCIAATAGFDLLPGTSVIVKARWPRNLIPPVGSDSCLLAAVLTRSDHPIAGRHVWEHNNLAQKNLTIVDLSPNDWFVLPFVVTNLQLPIARTFTLELRRPKGHDDLEASLLHTSKAVFKQLRELKFKPIKPVEVSAIHDKTTTLDCTPEATLSVRVNNAAKTRFLMLDRSEFVASHFGRGVEVFFAGGMVAQTKISVRAQDQLTFGLRLKLPRTVEKGETLLLDLVQRDTKSGKIVGGIAVRINVKGR